MPRRAIGRGALRPLAAFLGLTISYVAVGRLGLMLAIPPGYATAIFPPAGIAVCGALIIGIAALPATFIGALLLNLWTGYAAGGELQSIGIAAALVIATGSTAQAAIGGELLRRAIGYPARLDNGRDVVRFFAVAPAACLTSATLSLAGLWGLGAVGAPDLPVNWLVWWVGDTLGVLVVMPVMLAAAGEPRALWRRRGPFVAAPIIVFFALFAAIFSRVSLWEGDQALLEFRMRSQHLVDVAQASLQEQSVFLEQLGSAFGTLRSRITRPDFHVLVRRLLQRFPTIQAVEWAPRIEPADRAAFEAAQQDELPGFAIRERGPSGAMRPAPMHKSYYPVTYVEPLAGNQEAVGYNLTSNPDRRAAIAQAIATGKVVATAPIRLVQEHGGQTGILLTYWVPGGPNGPGIVLVVLRMGTFTENLLAPLGSILRVSFIDGADPEPPLFDDLHPRPAEPSFTAGFGFGTHHYFLDTEPTAAYRAAHRPWESWIVLMGGLFSTGLLGALLMLGSGHAQRAEQLVAERTSELRIANQRLIDEMAEREHAVAALQQARRMEAMGQLTGGVAHDFNNLLTIIIGNLELLHRHVAGEAGKRLLAMAESGAERGAKLVDALLTFARRQALRPERINPDRLIGEFSELMKRAVGETVDLRLHLGAAGSFCEIDTTQFQAALLNLVVNAREAMPDGGRLTIETRRVAPDDAPQDNSSGGETAAAERIAIAVRDTGVGMPQEVLDRVFEPFYTTREAGRGSGLGLSQVYGFVHQSGGHVEISSTPGAGTEVRISLPAAYAEAGAAPADEDAAIDLVGGTETILVVEDDPEVRRLTIERLETLGYRVLAAADGPEALGILEGGYGIDLLFSDVVMPKGMSGYELARRVGALRPGIRVLLTSGYAGRLPETDETRRFALLPKPYRGSDLARAIRAALDG